MSECAAIPQKFCKKCGVEKPLNEFPQHKDCCDGHEHRCKDCAKQYVAEWVARVPGYHKKKSAEYRKQHIMELRGKERQYYWEHVERKRAYRAAYYEKNKDYLTQYSKNFHKEHPEYNRYMKEKRRTFINGGHLQYGDFERLCKEYGDKCLACGSTEHITMDHIIPVVKGGVHSVENIQPLCKSCNSKKHTQIFDYRPYVPSWVICSTGKEMGNGQSVCN